MKRDNFTSDGTIKEFYNGNLHLKIDADRITEIKAGNRNALETFAYLLDALDCYLIGEPGSFGNDEMSQTIYNANNGECYTVLLYRDIERDFASGKTVKLYARTPNTSDAESINEFLGD